MSDINTKLLELIDKNYTVNEIINELNISREQLYKLFRSLKKWGMDFSKKCYSSGDFVYVPKKEICRPKNVNSIDIITEPKTDSFRAMILADLHAGNELQSQMAWDKIYNYCIVNNIHIIIIAGDFVDGIKVGRESDKIYNDPFSQVEYAAKNYPFDPEILNFVIMGNHDADLLLSYGIDFCEYLKNFRHDIIPIGYGRGRINIKNDKILLAHPLGIGAPYEHDLSSNFLLVKGHHHSFKTIVGANGSCSLSVPSLSNIFTSDNEFMPGAVDLSIKFRDGYFDIMYFEHLLIGDKVYSIGTTQCSISHGKDKKFDGIINNEEHLVKRKIKKSKTKELQ